MRSGAAVLALAVPLGLLSICGASLTARPLTQTPGAPAATLTSVIEEYRHGDAASALAEFMKWDARRMALEYDAWDSRRVSAKRFLPSDADIPDVAALVMLNTLAAVERDEFGISRRATTSEQFHYQPALRLVKGLVAARGSDTQQLRAFCRDWFVLATTLWMSARQCFQAATTAHNALDMLGPDAHLFLAAGSVAETQMGPFENGADVEPSCGEQWGPSVLSRHGSLVIHTPSRENAQEWLQRAVSLDPTLAEAHLRLGRVLYWAGRSTDAQGELERSIAIASNAERSVVGYLAALFLGQLHEEAHRVEEARAAYERAIEFNRRGGVAHLALGHLLIMSGDPGEGWTRVRGAFRDTADDGTGETDPWANYGSAQLWRASRLTRALEAWVRR